MRVILAFLILVLSVSGCSKPVKRQRISGTASNSINLNCDSSVEEEPDSITRISLQDTLIGKFDGLHLDTLISEPVRDSYVSVGTDGDIYGGWYYAWRIYTKMGTVEDLVLGNTVGIDFVREGDTDGDGKDEWGYISQWPTSNWKHYYIYKNYDGEWKLMIDPTPIWLGHIGDDSDMILPEQIIRKSRKKGFVRVKFSDVRNDGEDFLIIDTLIRVNPR